MEVQPYAFTTKSLFVGDALSPVITLEPRVERYKKSMSLTYEPFSESHRSLTQTLDPKP